MRNQQQLPIVIVAKTVESATRPIKMFSRPVNLSVGLKRTKKPTPCSKICRESSLRKITIRIIKLKLVGPWSCHSRAIWDTLPGYLIFKNAMLIVIRVVNLIRYEPIAGLNRYKVNKRHWFVTPATQCPVRFTQIRSSTTASIHFILHIR